MGLIEKLRPVEVYSLVSVSHTNLEDGSFVKGEKWDRYNSFTAVLGYLFVEGYISFTYDKYGPRVRLTNKDMTGLRDYELECLDDIKHHSLKQSNLHRKTVLEGQYNSWDTIYESLVDFGVYVKESIIREGDNKRITQYLEGPNYDLALREVDELRNNVMAGNDCSEMPYQKGIRYAFPSLGLNDECSEFVDYCRKRWYSGRTRRYDKKKKGYNPFSPTRISRWI